MSNRAFYILLLPKQQNAHSEAYSIGRPQEDQGCVEQSQEQNKDAQQECRISHKKRNDQIRIHSDGRPFARSVVRNTLELQVSTGATSERHAPFTV